MAKRRERIRGVPKTAEKFTCTNSSCGFIFSAPIKVKNLCEDSQVYDACPRCFTAMNGIGNASLAEKEQKSCADTVRFEVSNKVGKKESEPTASKQCAHRFGYLSERAKNDKIPDDCLTCENIVKCMTKGMTA